jgi:hypothetical protein
MLRLGLGSCWPQQASTALSHSGEKESQQQAVRPWALRYHCRLWLSTNR